jgi:hypothetical protein
MILVSGLTLSLFRVKEYVDFLDQTIGSMIDFLVPGAVVLLVFGVHKCILAQQMFLSVGQKITTNFVATQGWLPKFQYLHAVRIISYL